MTEYNPNFGDPRVRRRCIKALIFLDKYVWNKAKPIAQSQIIKHFGNPGLPLGHYLKTQLLVCTDSHWNYQTGKCKQYVRNKAGVRALRRRLDLKEPVLCPQEQSELITGQFTYKTKTNRSWHPLQNRPNKLRRKIFSDQGYVYEYDLENAAVTLLYQYAQKIRLQNPRNHNRHLQLPHIEYYLTNKDSLRDQLAQHSGFDHKQIKRVLSALFQGAKLIANDRCSLFYDLDLNYQKTQLLKQHPILIELQKEIRQMWKILNKDIKERTQVERIKTKHKSQLYRELEEQVMGVIWRKMGRDGVGYFREHDGWRSRAFVIPNEIEQAVRTELGYVIKIKWNKVERLY